MWQLLSEIRMVTLSRAGSGILLLLLMEVVSNNGLCPDPCQCKWKGGKETVECVNASLSVFPALDPTTQVLDLSLNYLERVRENTFRSRGLLNLQKIYLRYCSLSFIEGRCFEDMTNLVELDLSFNLLQSVPAAALADCHYLMSLSLAGNPIRSVSPAQLASLKFLQTLDLSACQLVHIDAKAFAHLAKMATLRLDNNRLETLDPSEDLPPATKLLTLHANRWRCDCGLVGLKDFLAHNRSVSVPMEPLCSAPHRISGQRVSDLATADMACPPLVSPTSSFEETVPGKNITLVCLVTSRPMGTITWSFKGLVIGNGSTLTALEIAAAEARTYYYRNTVVREGVVKSELVLDRTTESDNGGFQCEVTNKAGTAVGNFTVSVVTPAAPLPPKEIVEERFKQEYFVVLGITAVVVSILIIVVTTVFLVRCRRRSTTTGGGGSGQSRTSNGHSKGGSSSSSTSASGNSGGLEGGGGGDGGQPQQQLYQCSNSSVGSYAGSDKSLMAVHTTTSSSHANNSSTKISSCLFNGVARCDSIDEHTTNTYLEDDEVGGSDDDDDEAEAEDETTIAVYDQIIENSLMENLLTSSGTGSSVSGKLASLGRTGGNKKEGGKKFDLGGFRSFRKDSAVECDRAVGPSDGQAGSVPTRSLSVETSSDGQHVSIVTCSTLNHVLLVERKHLPAGNSISNREKEGGGGGGSLKAEDKPTMLLKGGHNLGTGGGKDGTNATGSKGDNHWHFSTLPRKRLDVRGGGSTTQTSAGGSCGSTIKRGQQQQVVDLLSSDMKHFVPVSSGSPAAAGDRHPEVEIILPPPPQFKGVHFDPETLAGDADSDQAIAIPLEGLPKHPAASNQAINTIKT